MTSFLKKTIPQKMFYLWLKIATNSGERVGGEEDLLCSSHPLIQNAHTEIKMKKNKMKWYTFVKKWIDTFFIIMI